MHATRVKNLCPVPMLSAFHRVGCTQTRETVGLIPIFSLYFDLRTHAVPQATLIMVLSFRRRFPLLKHNDTYHPVSGTEGEESLRLPIGFYAWEQLLPPVMDRHPSHRLHTNVLRLSAPPVSCSSAPLI